MSADYYSWAYEHRALHQAWEDIRAEDAAEMAQNPIVINNAYDEAWLHRKKGGRPRNEALRAFAKEQRISIRTAQRWKKEGKI